MKSKTRRDKTPREIGKTKGKEREATRIPYAVSDRNMCEDGIKSRCGKVGGKF